MALLPAGPVAEALVVLHRRARTKRRARPVPQSRATWSTHASIPLRVHTEVVTPRGGHPRRSADQDERLGPLRVVRRELHAGHRAERRAEQHRVRRVARVEHRGDVACELRQRESITGCGRVIGKPGPAPVEHHDARARGEPAHEVLERGLFPRDFHLADQRRDHHDRDGPLAERRVGDRHVVVGAGVPHLRANHAVTVRDRVRREKAAVRIRTRSRVRIRRRPCYEWIMTTIMTPGFDLERAFARHRGELQGYCVRILGSTAEAEDAVQDTLVRGWRHIDRFEGRATLRSWLFRIATNVCNDMLRGKMRPRRSDGPRRRRPRGRRTTIPQTSPSSATPSGARSSPRSRCFRRGSGRWSSCATCSAGTRPRLPRCSMRRRRRCTACINVRVPRWRRAVRVGTTTIAADDATVARYVDAFEQYDIATLVGLLRAA